MKKCYFCIDSSQLKYRFIENLKLCKIESHFAISNDNIFKYPYSGIPNYIIDTKTIDDTVMMFIEEYAESDKIKIFLYHHNADLVLVEQINNKVTHLLNQETDNPGCVNIQKYINNHIFFDRSSNTPRSNIMAGFLGEVSEIPFNLTKYLMLSDSKKETMIRLFDNPDIANTYNVGIISEHEKANILQTYKYFLNINDSYIYEAIACGITVLDHKNMQPIDKNLYKGGADISKFIEFLL
jgi:hypothetical protein